MKKIIVLLTLFPLFAWAQNPLDVRTNKSPKGYGPAIDAETIDGRTSQLPSFMSPIPFVIPATQNSSTVSYRVKYDPTDGLPIYLEVYSPATKGGFGTYESNDNMTLSKVLSDLPGLFRWDAGSELRKVSESTSEQGVSHIRYQQYIHGVSVLGGEWMLHILDGEVLSGNGKIYPSTDKKESSISAEEAEKIATNHIYTNVKAYQAPGQYGVTLHRSHEIALSIDYELGEELSPTLVYRVEVRPTDMYHYEVWVDATTGKILKVQDELCSIDGPKTASATNLNSKTVTVKSYQVGSTYYMVDATKSMWTNSQPSGFPSNPRGAIWTIDAGNTAAQSFTHVTSNSNSWSERSSVSAHTNAGIAFDYFKNTHNRNSLNGSGGTITSVVNVSNDDGSSMANAYWNGQAMFYGNGGSTFKPLAGALDVAGHELTHGVVSNSANLEYQGQSGAINESMADVFGAMMDREDWKVGEDVVKPGVFSGGALRNIQNPHNGGSSLSHRGYQPAKMSEFYTGTQDNEGVHINSGIVNKAFYLAATGTGMSKDIAEKVWYKALTAYLTKRSKFLDLRYACIDAAKEIYSGSTETTVVNAVKAAFDGVEIYDPNGSGGGSGGTTDQGGDFAVNSGTENIVSLDLNTGDANTFYKSTTVPNGWKALTTNTPKRRCSITDNGDQLVYVTSGDKLTRILLNTPFTETTLSNDDWDNVAISKDGNRLALVSTEIDGKIWVYDFVKSVWKTFELYNPTYTEGVDAGNVNYADALEFDNTGQFLMYDAQNEIVNSSGSNLKWWDVGVLRVWDNDANGWGDGKVEKIFTQLPDGVSIGNATYSKNSSYIIAYDYISASDYSVVATNTRTNKSGTIITQNQLGFPNFSNKDDKIIFDAKTNGGDEVVAVRDLASDKINTKAGSSAAVLISDGKWGVWYANGTRKLLSDKKELISFSFPSLSGSPIGVFSGTTVNVDVPGGTDLSSLAATFVHSADATVSVSGTVQTSGVNRNSFSSTVTYSVTAQDKSTRDYQINVNVVAAVDQLDKKILLYPNPVSQKLTISSDLHITSVKCYGISGQEMDVVKTGQEVDLSNLTSGLYFIEIQTPQGKIVKRISKQ